MRVVVYGGRDYTNRRMLYAVMDRLHARMNFSTVIHGDYRGADWLARDWARVRGILDEPYAAEWKRYRGRAGPIRNQRMITEAKPEFGIEFPGQDGTADMRARLVRAGVAYCYVEVHHDWGRLVGAGKDERVELEVVA